MLAADLILKETSKTMNIKNLMFQTLNYLQFIETRTVRGSDYSPTVELSEQKDKLVTATGDTEKIF